MLCPQSRYSSYWQPERTRRIPNEITNRLAAYNCDGAGICGGIRYPDPSIRWVIYGCHFSRIASCYRSRKSTAQRIRLAGISQNQGWKQMNYRYNPNSRAARARLDVLRQRAHEQYGDREDIQPSRRQMLASSSCISPMVRTKQKRIGRRYRPVFVGTERFQTLHDAAISLGTYDSCLRKLIEHGKTLRDGRKVSYARV
jgi:hypothetical protein